MDSTPQDFGALVIFFLLPDNEDLQPPQEEHNKELNSRYILYNDKMFKLVDNMGDGLCFSYSVSSFLGDLLSQEKSSTPNGWVPSIGLNDSTRSCESKAILFLTQFLCTLSEADFDVLNKCFGFSDDKKPKQSPTKYTLLVENLRNNFLVKTEQTLEEDIVKWVTHFLFEMINTANTKDGSWPGEIYALVLSKMLKIRIVIVSNYWMGLEGWFGTDSAFFILHDFKTPYQVQHPKIKKHLTCIK
jgi:hypothetical protein